MKTLIAIFVAVMMMGIAGTAESFTLCEDPTIGVQMPVTATLRKLERVCIDTPTPWNIFTFLYDDQGVGETIYSSETIDFTLTLDVSSATTTVLRMYAADVNFVGLNDGGLIPLTGSNYSVTSDDPTFWPETFLLVDGVDVQTFMGAGMYSAILHGNYYTDANLISASADDYQLITYIEIISF